MSRPSFPALRSALVICALALLVSMAATADAKKKKKKGAATACDISYLPFITGTTWTYQYAVPPNAIDAPGGIRAQVPETFQITVKNVEANSNAATITLEETYREVARTTTLTCDRKAGLIVPIDSFFFAGELPGALGITIENLKLDGEMYPGKGGLKKGESYYVDVKATLIRAAGGESKVEHSKSKLELERQISVGPREDIEVEHGIHSAYAVEVALSGRLALDVTPDKSVPLPEGKALLWFAKGLGVVRAYNRMGQGWELSEMTNAAGEAVEL